MSDVAFTTTRPRTDSTRRDESRRTTVIRALRLAESEIRAAYMTAETVENGRDRTRLLSALSDESARVRHLREAIALGGPIPTTDPFTFA